MKVERSPQRAKKTVGERGGGDRGLGHAGKGTTQRRDPAARAERSSTGWTAGGEPKGRGAEAERPALGPQIAGGSQSRLGWARSGAIAHRTQLGGPTHCRPQ